MTSQQLLAERRGARAGRTLWILGQVASALDAAHAAGSSTGDVKPANVLLREGRRITSTSPTSGDQEQASSDRAHRDGVQFVGTPDLRLPPSRSSAEPVDGPHGRVRARMRPLRMPCRASAVSVRLPDGTLWAYVHHDPPPLSDDLDPIVAKGLAKSPGDRYATCLDLVLASRDAVGRTAEAAASDRAATGPLLGRREFLIGAGVVAVAVAGVVPAVILTRAGGKNAAPPLAPPDALARIEETTNQVTDVVPDFPVTRAVTSGEGAVWVLSNVASVVLRVDPETLAATSQGVPGNPTSIAAGAGAIWVTTTFGGVGYLLALDPDTQAARRGEFPSHTRSRGGSSWETARSGFSPTTHFRGTWPFCASRRRPSFRARPPSPLARSPCRVILCRATSEPGSWPSRQHPATRRSPRSRFDRFGSDSGTG